MTPNIDTRLKQCRRLLKAGQAGKAIALYKKLLRRAPDSTEVHHGIARAYKAAGQFRNAVPHFNQAIKLGARSAEIFAENAEAMNSQRLYDEAENMARAAVSLDPKLLSGNRQLVKALLSQGKYNDAIVSAEQLVRESPNSAGDRILLGWTYGSIERYDAAIAQAKKAIELDSSSADARYLLSRVYKNVQKWDKAMALAEQASELQPGNKEFIAMKADMLEHQGQYEEAFALVAPLVECVKSPVGLAVHVYASLSRKFGKQDKAVSLLENLASREKGFVGMQHATLTLLGNSYDSMGQYDKAFAAIDQANKVRPARYSDENLEAYISCISKWFGKDRFEEVATGNPASVRPIFIVGMPRSGTSLTEKILSRHPEVYAAGELMHLPVLLHRELPLMLGKEKLFPDCLEDLTPEIADKAASTYLQKITGLQGSGKTCMSDKRPMNYMYLGAIALLFPGAKIINCTRDPLDIGLSCYFANFASSSEMGFSQNLEHIGQYFRRYQQLMAHWHEVLPMPILDLSYESLVRDPDVEIAKLLKFCDLPWNEDCLSPHKSAQVTTTASYDQVRKPINTGSIGRWKRYERHLAPLKQALGLMESEAA